MSRVQFNLLPDVKLEYIRTERTRNRVISLSIIVSAISFAIFLLLFLTVNVVQKAQLSSAKADVEKTSKRLQDNKELAPAVTVQSQLGSLVTLHQNKHVSSRIFTYLPEITPTNVNISSLTMDFSTNAMTITGTADNHQSVNKFIDTLKFTTFKIGDEAPQRAFPSVIESSFGISSTNVTYGLNIQFEPELFANNILDESGKVQTPKLTVPTQTTKRSTPDAATTPLFNSQTPAGGRQ